MDGINEVTADILKHEVESMGERSKEKGNFDPDNTVYLNLRKFIIRQLLLNEKTDFNISPYYTGKCYLQWKSV